MKLTSLKKIFVIALLFQFVFIYINAQNFTPNFDPQNPTPRKKKQKEIPRFPPQFRAKDTVGGKVSPAFIAPKQATNKPNGITTTTIIKAPPLVKKQDTIYKVISNKIDINGNEIKNVDMIVGIRRWNYTYITGNAKQLNIKFDADTINKDSITIQVIKKNYRMYVYYKHRFLTSYKCVFGPDPMSQKQREGDRRTPEGTFKINLIKGHAEWTMFMMFDYPNFESYKNFEDNKKCGAIPKDSRIGGAVGIHSVWADADMVIDQKHNWTDGCIALKHDDILELNRMIKLGTPITIKREADKIVK
jgi:L,D-transpeptidase catalytic domain